MYKQYVKRPRPFGGAFVGNPGGGTCYGAVGGGNDHALLPHGAGATRGRDTGGRCGNANKIQGRGVVLAAQGVREK